MLLEIGGEGRGKRGQPTEVGAKGVQLLQLHPLAGGRPPHHIADPGEAGGDPPGRLALAAPVAEGGVVDLPLAELLAVSLEGPFRSRKDREERGTAGAELAGLLVAIVLVLPLLNGHRQRGNDRQFGRLGGEGRHIPRQAPGVDEPERRHALAEITRQRQLRRPAAQAAHESAVGIGAEEAARREERHHEKDEAPSHHELAADGASLAHSVLPAGPGLSASSPSRGLGSLRGGGE